MKLFFDEDLGKGVAIALHAVGVTSYYVGPKRLIKKRTPDEEWIPIAGRQGWLVVSANKEILQTETQRDLWITNQVGGIFLTSGQINSVNLLRLMLRKLSWMERIDRDAVRPFAFMLTPGGDTYRAPEIPIF